MSNRFIPTFYRDSLPYPFPLPDLPDSAKIVKVTRTFDPMGPAMIIDCSRNPRASRSKIKDANVKDAISREPLLQDSAHPDQSSSIRSELWCLPMSAILDHKLTTNRWSSGEPTSRALPVARHSFFFLPFSLPPPLILPLVFLFFSYSVSHSRTRRLTYLAADQTGVDVRFLANVPRRILT